MFRRARLKPGFCFSKTKVFRIDGLPKEKFFGRKNMREKMKINKKTLNKIIKSGILLVVLGVASYFIWLVFMAPNKSEADSVNCLESVFNNLTKEWQEGCRAEGKVIGADGTCPVSPEKAGQLHEKYEKQKNECIKSNASNNL